MAHYEPPHLDLYCLLSCHCSLNEIAWTKQLTDCIHLIYSYLMRYVTVCCLLFLEISLNSTVSWPLLLIVKHSYGAIIDVININVLLFHTAQQRKSLCTSLIATFLSSTVLILLNAQWVMHFIKGGLYLEH